MFNERLKDSFHYAIALYIMVLILAVGGFMYWVVSIGTIDVPEEMKGALRTFSLRTGFAFGSAFGLTALITATGVAIIAFSFREMLRLGAWVMTKCLPIYTGNSYT